MAINGEGKIVVFNPAAGRIFGLSPEEMVGRDLSRLFPPGTFEAHRQRVLNYYAGGGGGAIGATIKAEGWHSSGRSFPLEISLSEAQNGDQRLALASIRDISARVKAADHSQQLTEQLSQGMKMEAQVTMAVGIAHDFNKSLGTIEAITTSLVGDLGRGHPAYKRLQQVLQTVVQASDLTEHLLNFCSPAKGDFEIISLNRVVRDVVSLLRSVLASGISIRTQKEPGVYVEGDSGALINALMNLGLNARDAMPDGGELLITTRSMTLSREAAGMIGLPPANYRTLVVKDTGMGISEDVLSKIFDPFFSTKNRERGYGLGLATVYATIKAHGGTIIPNTAEDQGTEFTIFLPASEREPAPDRMTPVESQSPIAAGETILLVEDENALREMTCYLLEKLGYKVIPAATGEEAVALFGRHRKTVELVILDVVLTDISGQEVLHRIQQAEPLVKVLVTSGFRREDEPRELLNAGALGFLKKPYGIVEISREVKKILMG